MDELERLKFPWLEDKAPFQIMKNVYFVGVDWVSAFLLDTSEGLVLIDCAMQETFYLLVDSIHGLGFDPRRIKKLLLTHAAQHRTGNFGTLLNRDHTKVPAQEY